MAKKFIGPDGKVYKEKKRGGCLSFIIIAAVVFYFGDSFGLFNSNENKEGVNQETEFSISQTTTQQITQTAQETEIDIKKDPLENNEISSGQIDNINTKLSDDLNESHQFAIDGNTSYDSYLTIDNIYFQMDGILVAEINDDFFNLTDEEKDEVALSIHGMGQLAKYFILKDEKYLNEEIYMSFRYGGEIIGNTKLLGTGVEWR